MSDDINNMFLHIGDDTNAYGEYSSKIFYEQHSIKQNRDYWVTKDGKVLYPKQMSDNHIKNTIKLIENKCRRAKGNPINFKIYNLLIAKATDRNIALQRDL